MYRLALRFCGNPIDAEDAAQEVLIRLVWPRVVRGTLPVHHVGAHGGGASVAAHRPPRPRRRSPALMRLVRSSTATSPILSGSRRHGWSTRSCARTSGCRAPTGCCCACRQDQRVAYLLGDLLGFQRCRRGGDLRDHPGRVPPAPGPGPGGDAHAHGRTVRPGARRQPVPLRPAGPRRYRQWVAGPARSPVGSPWRGHPADRDDYGRHAARELDLAVAAAEVFRTDPSFAAPATSQRDRLARAIPTLLGDR